MALIRGMDCELHNGLVDVGNNVEEESTDVECRQMTVLRT